MMISNNDDEARLYNDGILAQELSQPALHHPMFTRKRENNRSASHARLSTSHFIDKVHHTYFSLFYLKSFLSA